MGTSYGYHLKAVPGSPFARSSCRFHLNPAFVHRPITHHKHQEGAFFVLPARLMKR
jgi:hypothetical protein